VPTGDWFATPAPHAAGNSQANLSGKNRPSEVGGNSALPYDALSAFLTTGNEVRVQGTEALAGSNRQSIKQTEWTYSLMMYISKSLGVNCTYCHNTRALGRWEESMPQRSTAWHGIRMVRQLNTAYLMPLQSVFPANRLSVEGDGPKVGCATCHKGTYKPLYGVSSLKDYPVLAGVVAAAASAPAPAPAPAPAATQATAASAPASDKVTSDAGGGTALALAARPR
jgi:photosynthetic reaction center cytochrome c subunit